MPAVDVKRAIQAGSVDSTTCAKKQRGEVRQADNAERDCHRMFVRMGYSLPVPIQEVTHEVESELITTHWVRMTDYCSYFLKRAPFLLCGGNGSDLHHRLKSFWEAYRCHHPGHKVYEDHANELERVIPFCWHGDEGKGPKRATFMDFSFETPLGLSLQDENFTCSCSQDIAESQQFLVSAEQVCRNMDRHDACCARSITHNAAGHSYLKRYLLFGLPHAWYKDDMQPILDKHLELVTEDAVNFFEKGIVVDDQIYYGAFLGLKGDLKFHKDVTISLTRCYANLGKTRSLMMCSFCWAGLAEYPFEEVDECPNWSQTMFADRPWRTPPVFAQVPFDQDKPEFALKLDVFQTMKVGFSRDVVASIIVTLCRLKYFDFDDTESLSINARLKRAHGAFRLWCAGAHCSPGLRSFTRSFFNCTTSLKAPWANAKGSDVTMMLQWLSFLIPLILKTRDLEAPEHKNLLKVMCHLTNDILNLHRILQTHGLFLQRQCAQRLHQLIMKIAKSYHWLARQVMVLQVVGFSLKPKYHCLKHIAYQLRKEILSCSEFCLNPLAFNCEGNVDHVGRVCKLGRSVSTRTISKRVIQRYFLKTRALIRRHQDSLLKKK